MPRHTQSPPTSAQRLLFWFSQAARDARLQAGANTETVAGLLGVKGRTVERFEVADHWPNDPDRLAVAYARVAALDDPRDIYRLALGKWYKLGKPPQLNRRAEDADARQRLEIPQGLPVDIQDLLAEQPAAPTPKRDRRAS